MNVTSGAQGCHAGGSALTGSISVSSRLNLRQCLASFSVDGARLSMLANFADSHEDGFVCSFYFLLRSHSLWKSAFAS